MQRWERSGVRGAHSPELAWLLILAFHNHHRIAHWRAKIFHTVNIQLRDADHILGKIGQRKCFRTRRLSKSFKAPADSRRELSGHFPLLQPNFLELSLLLPRQGIGLFAVGHVHLPFMNGFQPPFAMTCL